MRIAILFLALSACFGTAHAQQPYGPPAMTGPVVLGPSVLEQVRDEEQAAARALAERRQRMIGECIQNHGSETDCERETDTELRAEGLPWRNRVIQPGRFQ
jgi:hypothetical protein